MSKTSDRCVAQMLVLYLGTWLIGSLVVPSRASDDEIRLIYDLFERRGYNPLIRPVANISESLTIIFEVALSQIVLVDERNQIMKTNVWLQLTWTDTQLRWQPEDYGGIEIIRILPNKVWRPDIVLYNNADGKYEVSYVSNVLVNYDSSINWVPPAIYKSTCTIDVEFFPFDEQVCGMTFGSWTFNAQEITFGWMGQDGCSVELKDYVTSGVWDVMEARGRVVKEGVGEQAKAYVIYDFRIRRKTLFYTVNLIIPCVLISFLTVCVFYLPVIEGEKVTMSISILLALVVFLLLVSKILPATSISIPLISRYLLFTFILNIFAILTTIIIINLNFRTPRTHQMPQWIATIFLNFLPKLLLMGRADHVVEEEMRQKLQADMLRHKDVFANRGAVSPIPLPLPLANDAAAQARVESLLQSLPQELDDGNFPPPPPSTSISFNSIKHLGASSTEIDIHNPLTCRPRRSTSSLRLREVSPAKRAGLTILSTDSMAYDGTRNCDGNSTDLYVNSNAPVSSSRQMAGFRSPSNLAGSGITRAELLSSTSNFIANRHSQKVKKRKKSYKHAALHKELNDTIEAVDFMVRHLENENEYNQILEDWKVVAAVIDRVQLIIFLLVTAVGTISFFLKAPHIFEFVDQMQVIERLRMANKTILCANSIRL